MAIGYTLGGGLVHSARQQRVGHNGGSIIIVSPGRSDLRTFSAAASSFILVVITDCGADIELEPEDIRQPDVFILPLAEWKRILRDGFPARELDVAAFPGGFGPTANQSS